MTTRSIQMTDLYEYEGKLIGLGSTQVLTKFSPVPDRTLSTPDADGDKVYNGSEAGTLGSEDILATASGTVTAAVSLGGLLTVSLGSSVPVNVFELDGSTVVQYPEGDQAALLDGLLSKVSAVSGLSTILAIAGIKDLPAYLEKNAVLTFELDGGTAAIPVCFGKGCQIMTLRGEVSVERLAKGDLVLTRDSGFRPILWAGHARVRAEGRMAPIRFATGAIDNVRPMLLSPEHRVLVCDPHAELLTGQVDMFVPAKHLVNGKTIRVRSGGWVDYYHFLLDGHQIVFANGSPCETFHPGATALRALDREARDEILELFPELKDGKDLRCTARGILKQHEVSVLAMMRAARQCMMQPTA